MYPVALISSKSSWPREKSVKAKLFSNRKLYQILTNGMGADSVNDLIYLQYFEHSLFEWLEECYHCLQPVNNLLRDSTTRNIFSQKFPEPQYDHGVGT